MEGHPQLPDAGTTLETTITAVAEWIHLPADQRPRLIDCREADELAICKIEGHEWIPLRDFPEKLALLSTDAERGIVVYCHHGMPSQRAASFLRSHGVEQAFSMRGGIDEWAAFIDLSMARY